MRCLSNLAFGGFALSLFAHLLTFWEIDIIERFPAIWLLHLGAFIFYIPIIILDRKFRQSQNMPDILSIPMPNWLRLAIYGFFYYAIINFILFFFLSSGGAPDEHNGKYFLKNHGQVIRELTLQEYRQQKAYIIRGFSGHSMLFYLIPAAYFRYYKSESSSNNV
ncbi:MULTISPECIES: hypothetical protein [Aerosakkonema]|uniref:hypothetical protein n=1 Tax=Aerosakkonema TaxID=1246629 RepID=UPI0035BB09CB